MRKANVRLAGSVVAMTVSSIMCHKAVYSGFIAWVLSVAVMAACAYFMVYSLDEFLSDAD
jgi:hypothetical protein